MSSFNAASIEKELKNYREKLVKTINRTMFVSKLPHFIKSPRLYQITKSVFCSSTTEILKNFKTKIENGPTFHQFVTSDANLRNSQQENGSEINLYDPENDRAGQGRKVYIETYGCQMNVNDTELINAILEKEGFTITQTLFGSDVILIMTCAIREGAEQKIWKRIENLKFLKKRRRSSEYPLKIGILGCMAERLKHKVLDQEKLVDIVAGPDSYRSLPSLLSLADSGQKAVNVMLSADETYADIMPLRMNPEKKSAFISVMRGCDNMCTFCIVPFTRGRERSRPVSSILDEVKYLSDRGYKEITLLGQNVNSYRDLSEFDPTVQAIVGDVLSKGFTTVYKNRAGGLRFADLLAKAADINPEMRIRFTSPHPKDFPDAVLQVIKEKHNVCKQIHLPAQSGNSLVLSRMRRGYTREAYLELVDHLRSSIPRVALTSDFISGFCGETEEQHQDSLSLMDAVRYEFVYVFPYSLRNKTAAYHQLKDDVPEDVKKRRAQEIHDLFRLHALELHQREIGTEHLVLVVGPSRRSPDDWSGRNDANTKVIFPHSGIPIHPSSDVLRMPSVGDYVVVKIKECSSQVLKGEAVCHTTLQEFYRSDENGGNNSDRLQFSV